MVSEIICFEILKMMRGNRATITRQWDDSADSTPKIDYADNSITVGGLYQPLLARYDLADIESAMRWLTVGGFLSKTEWGLRGPWVHTLTEKACTIADAGSFSDEDKKLFYRTDPYAVFIAHQFNKDDEELVNYIKDTVLEPNGFRSLDGRAEGLEEFRHSILTKIQKARFFLCLLTCRNALESGSFVSSVWLYQEIGAAMAFGKKPLILVEKGIDPQYVGELQRVYEYTNFTRSNHPRVFKSILQKLQIDLESALIPLPDLLLRGTQPGAGC